MFGVDDAVIAAGLSSAVSGAGSLIGGSMANSANSAQAAASNYIQSQEFINSANIQQSEFASSQSFNSQQAAAARAWTAGQQLQAEQYNTDMSNTAYQRAVAGMKAAGLNPILSAGTGGASTPTMGTPSGASASSPSPGVIPVPSAKTANMQDVIGPAVSSALQGARLSSDLQSASKARALTDSQIENVESQTAYNLQNASNAKELGRRISAEADAADHWADLQAMHNVALTSHQDDKTAEETRGAKIVNDSRAVVGNGDVWNAGTYYPALAGFPNGLVSSWASPVSSSTAGTSAPNPGGPTGYKESGGDIYLLNKANKIAPGDFVPAY